MLPSCLYTNSETAETRPGLSGETINKIALFFAPAMKRELTIEIIVDKLFPFHQYHLSNIFAWEARPHEQKRPEKV